ncbi:MAG: hypothetical protein HOP19_01350 [Acidobacteria bacterium]|nr:hypothetical protein [Acidobacteriota bacterium]
MKTRFLLSLAWLCLCASFVVAQTKTENVILVSLDGARCEEVFGGLDLNVLKSKTRSDRKVEDSALYKQFYAATAEERRMKLMPFFWGTLMKEHGSIAGNRALGSAAMTTNKMWFSYPGYSEILTGQAHDEVIKSNDRIRNQFPSVLEFLKGKLKLNDKQVAGFSSWDVMNWIAESKEGSITLNAGYEPYDLNDPRIKVMNEDMKGAPSPWDSVRHDHYTFEFAMAHLRRYQPRVLFLSLGETDDWAHGGNYEQTLKALQRNDGQFKALWEYLQSTPQYRGKTSIIFTVDHGRGPTPLNWMDHGEKVPEAQYIWMAFVSPDSALRGEWKNAETIYQNQVAATLSKWLKFDYAEQNANAGKPIAQLFGGK